MVKLVFLDKPFAGQVYALTQERTAVGRTPPHDLVIPSDSVSANHCEVLTWGDEVIVRDLGSANGTYVNEIRVSKQSAAKSGQIIRFGSVEARLEIDYARTNDDETDMTAIHQHVQAVRALKPEKSRPPATPMTLESAELSIPMEETVLLKQESPAQVRAVEPPSEPFDTRAGKPAWNRLALKAILAALGLGLLPWLMWSLLGR